MLSDSFSTCVKAGITEYCNVEFKKIFETAFKRFCLIDSYGLIQFFKKLIDGSIGIEPGDIARMSPVDKRRIQMFYYTVWQKPPEKEGFADIYEAVARLRRCGVICKELNQLLDLLAERVDMVGKAGQEAMISRLMCIALTLWRRFLRPLITIIP